MDKDEGRYVGIVRGLTEGGRNNMNDDVRAKIEGISAKDFGRQMARYIVQRPSSAAYGIVSAVFHDLDPNGLEWNDITAFLIEIANQT